MPQYRIFLITSVIKMENFSFFSKNLKTYLFANDITRAALADRLGVESASTVGKWINHNRTPPGTIMRLLEALSGISTDEFVNQDLTLKIIKDAKYTTLLAEPENTDYTENATIKRMARHIEETMEQLRILEKASEKVLESVKMG
jgi:transcriptional regulator with XRE-family HTH domain